VVQVVGKLKGGTPCGTRKRSTGKPFACFVLPLFVIVTETSICGPVGVALPTGDGREVRKGEPRSPM
jgi:hypothetical protein